MGEVRQRASWMTNRWAATQRDGAACRSGIARAAIGDDVAKRRWLDHCAGLIVAPFGLFHTAALVDRIACTLGNA